LKAEPENEKIVKYYIRAMLTATDIEDVSSDPKEKIIIAWKAESLFNEKLKDKKKSYTHIGRKIQLKKGQVSLNHLQKEKLQMITSVLLRDTKLDKAFSSKVLTLLGQFYAKQADF